MADALVISKSEEGCSFGSMPSAFIEAGMVMQAAPTIRNTSHSGDMAQHSSGQNRLAMVSEDDTDASDEHADPFNNRSRRWTIEEHHLLEALVAKHGTYRQWSVIASQLPGRTGKQCRERWLNHMAPNIKKGNWTTEEEYTIAHLHSLHGNHWSKISKQLKGRPDNCIKNHWNATYRSKQAPRGAGFLWAYISSLKAGCAPSEAFSKACSAVPVIPPGPQEDSSKEDLEEGKEEDQDCLEALDPATVKALHRLITGYPQLLKQLQLLSNKLENEQPAPAKPSEPLAVEASPKADGSVKPDLAQHPYPLPLLYMGGSGTEGSVNSQGACTSDPLVQLLLHSRLGAVPGLGPVLYPPALLTHLGLLGQSLGSMPWLKGENEPWSQSPPTRCPSLNTTATGALAEDSQESSPSPDADAHVSIVQEPNSVAGDKGRMSEDKMGSSECMGKRSLELVETESLIEDHGHIGKMRRVISVSHDEVVKALVEKNLIPADMLDGDGDVEVQVVVDKVSEAVPCKSPVLLKLVEEPAGQSVVKAVNSEDLVGGSSEARGAADSGAELKEAAPDEAAARIQNIQHLLQLIAEVQARQEAGKLPDL